MDVSIRPVRKRTKRMKEPSITMPGRSWRWAIRPRIMRMKRMPREPVATE